MCQYLGFSPILLTSLNRGIEKQVSLTNCDLFKWGPPDLLCLVTASWNEWNNAKRYQLCLGSGPGFLDKLFLLYIILISK